ncbi:redox-regulated ATPase YchF [Candidatus Peregrinibacteria bacterium]|nr:MAG: redox-regulated ATPase YchF [Candidatus Peregrinibacteria bacterium]
MQIGIVGLPNVGKSTLFNALTKSSGAEAANYPFCTIDPNVGVVEVPDKRVDRIAKIIEPKKIIRAITEFVDIAGLVKGASQGEGLGNKFLSHIRECDAIAQVLRVFENGDIIHVHDSVDARRDKEIVEMELVLADMQTVEKRVGTLARDAKFGGKESQAKLAVFEKIQKTLEEGIVARKTELDEEELLLAKELHLLTMKPILYIANTSEDMLKDFPLEETKKVLGLNADDILVPVCAKLEEELSELEDDEAKMFLEDLGMNTSGRDFLIQKAYEILGLETYFTAGVEEVRAWTYKKGSTAPECAGVIHTDFQRGFICADIVKTDDFVTAGGWSKSKEQGLVKMQGKEYIFQDGDVCLFKFNV